MAAILILFFVSGAVSLLYEVVWMRHLTLIFGVTTFATSAVLATFMGGLALGSFVFGRWADRIRRPLLAYAGLELAIGLYALGIESLFDALRVPYIALYRLELPYLALALGRAGLAALVLLPPTVLMGATLPILAAWFVRRRGDVGRQTGLLYFANTGGAVVGCTLAGFSLIEHAGLRAATWIAAGANFALALASFGLDRRLGGAAPRAEHAREVASDGAEAAMAHARDGAGVARVALWAIGLSGFAALAYEVFWTRALLRYIYNSTYAFTTMLAVFLAGIAIGSWLHNALPWRRTRPALLFAALELGIGLGFLASLLLFVDLERVSSLLLGGELNSFGESLRMMVLRSAAVLLLPAVLLGATVPLATQMVARHGTGIGRSVGRVYAVNTLGAIAGSLSVSFLLIPGLGMQNTLLLLVATNVAVAIALVCADLERIPQRVVAVAAGVAVVAGLAAVVPRDVFRQTFTDSRGGELVFYREGATDTIGVVERDGQRRIMYEDRRGTAATWSYPVGFLFGHLPGLLHPARPEHALHICFGVGNSLSAMVAQESIVRVDNVELSPHVVEAAQYFWTNDGVLDDPKVNTIIDDGRNYLMATDQVYDLIALEPPETFTAGVINLYTREFYEEAARKLAEDGVLVQWIPVGEGTLAEEKMLFRAFHEVFPHASAWQQLTRDGNVLLVGTKQPLRIDYQLLLAKMSEPRVRRDLWLSHVRDPRDLLSMFVFGPPELAEFVRGVEPVVDDKTVLDFAIPRRIGSGFGTGFFVRNVKQHGRTPLTAILRRTRFYYRARGSVVPYLWNLGDVDRSELAVQLRRWVRPSNREVMAGIPEEEWERWPHEADRG